MTRSGSDYSIGRPTGVCASSGEPLTPGVEYIATLCDHETDDGFDRQDFSADAWESGVRPERLFSYWRATVPTPDEKRRLFVDDAVLLHLFEQLAEDERPPRVAFRFVLALILMRKRRLKYVGRSQDDGQDLWLMQIRGGEADPEAPPVPVVNPHLTDDDIRDLTDELSSVLQGDL